MNSKKSSSGYYFNATLKDGSDLFQESFGICIASSGSDMDRDHII